MTKKKYTRRRRYHKESKQYTRIKKGGKSTAETTPYKFGENSKGEQLILATGLMYESDNPLAKEKGNKYWPKHIVKDPSFELTIDIEEEEDKDINHPFIVEAKLYQDTLKKNFTSSIYQLINSDKENILKNEWTDDEFTEIKNDVDEHFKKLKATYDDLEKKGWDDDSLYNYLPNRPKDYYTNLNSIEQCNKETQYSVVTPFNALIEYYAIHYFSYDFECGNYKNNKSIAKLVNGDTRAIELFLNNPKFNVNCIIDRKNNKLYNFDETTESPFDNDGIPLFEFWDIPVVRFLLFFFHHFDCVGDSRNVNLLKLFLKKNPIMTIPFKTEECVRKEIVLNADHKTLTNIKKDIPFFNILHFLILSGFDRKNDIIDIIVEYLLEKKMASFLIIAYNEILFSVQKALNGFQQQTPKNNKMIQETRTFLSTLINYNSTIEKIKKKIIESDEPDVFVDNKISDVMQSIDSEIVKTDKQSLASINADAATETIKGIINKLNENPVKQLADEIQNDKSTISIIEDALKGSVSPEIIKLELETAKLAETTDNQEELAVKGELVNDMILRDELKNNKDKTDIVFKENNLFAVRDEDTFNSQLYIAREKIESRVDNGREQVEIIDLEKDLASSQSEDRKKEIRERLKAKKLELEMLNIKNAYSDSDILLNNELTSRKQEEKEKLQERLRERRKAKDKEAESNAKALLQKEQEKINAKLSENEASKNKLKAELRDRRKKNLEEMTANLEKTATEHESILQNIGALSDENTKRHQIIRMAIEKEGNNQEINEIKIAHLVSSDAEQISLSNERTSAKKRLEQRLLAKRPNTA
jgi:hypothetical protein